MRSTVVLPRRRAVGSKEANADMTGMIGSIAIAISIEIRVCVWLELTAVLKMKDWDARLIGP